MPPSTTTTKISFIYFTSIDTMASTAEEVPVAADQPPQEEGHEAANTSSEATKPRLIKRPVKPDEAEYKKQMDALVEQIKRHRDRSDEISRMLSGKRTGSDTPETKALRTKLSTLRAEWQTTLVGWGTCTHRTSTQRASRCSVIRRARALPTCSPAGSEEGSSCRARDDQ